MTAPNVDTLECPACHSTNCHVGASGLGLCFDCAHQWDPKEVTAGPAPTIAPFAMAPVEDVYGPTDADVAAHPANVEPVTQDIGIPDVIAPVEPDAHTFPPTWDGLKAFRKAGGTITDELWYDNFILPAQEPLHPADAAGDEEAAAIQLTSELATLIVKAAVASMPGVLSPEETDIAPIGFLPADPGLFPIVEQAAVQAVRGVIAVFDLDAAALLEAIGAGGGE